MQRREISQILMRRICTLMEESATSQKEMQVGSYYNSYTRYEFIIEAGSALALFLRAKGWVGMELGCMFRSHYRTVTVEEIEISEVKGKHYRWTHTRKCLRLRELSVA